MNRKFASLKKMAVGKKLAAAAFAMVAGISAAHAYTLDTYLGAANLSNSGDGTELSTFQNLAGTTLILDDKVENNISVALNPGTTDQWYIDVGADAPGYFLLKFGIGGTGATADTFFFQNIGELSKLVFSNSQVQNLTGGDCGAENNSACNIGRLSHYVTYNGGEGGGGGTGNVPEPSTVALLGLGLLGATAARRKAAKGKAE